MGSSSLSVVAINPIGAVYLSLHLFCFPCLDWLVILSLATLLLPGPSCLRLTDISTDDTSISLDLSATRVAVPCPSCLVLSSHVHSLYQRTVADLPWAGVPLTLHLHVRRFICRHPACPRVTFSEPLPEVVAPSARRSLRLANEQRQLGLQVGGSVAARIAQRQGMPVSPTTILRLIRRTRMAEKATPTLLGVDEWAYRRRLDFKTILVDLSTNRPLELLPDASATTFASWLQAHPGVEVIARDRAGTFAEGARQGAPDAVQVADRFHLMQNLRTALEQILNQMVDVRQTAAEALAEQLTQLQPSAATLDASSAGASVPLPDLRRVRDPYRKRVQAQRRAQRLARYEQVLALHQAGALQQEIAERLQITRATVSRYLKSTRFPERAPYPRLESKLDPYQVYLSERWAAGETNGRQLWQELQSQGFTGSLMSVMRWAGRQQLLSPPPPTSRRGHNQQAKGEQNQQPVAPLRTRRVAWWLLRRPDTLSTGHQAVLARMVQADPTFGQLYRLTVQFTEMLRNRQPEQLRPWLDAAEASGLAELKSLADGMERDYAAVEAALRLPYSTGPVEGNINRLKLIKRSGYGRAGFDLLRLRVLEA
jgi:transposase